MKQLIKKYKSIIETILFFFLIFLINFLLNKNNLLYVKDVTNLYFFGLMIISLFYGLLESTIFLGLYFAFEYFIFETIDLHQFLIYFLTTMIINEFVFYWKNKINKTQAENSYLKERLNKLGVAYYLLKISHEELEKNYILKPFSLRKLLDEIRKSEDKKETIIDILINYFKIESACFYFIKKEEFKLYFNIGEKIELDTNDPLIKETVTNNNSTYIVNKKNSKYLAVLPVFNNNEEITALFIINKIPFFSLSKENLILISLILNYFTNLITLDKKYLNLIIPADIAKEIDILHNYYKIYNTESNIVIFKVKDIEKTKIKRLIRGSDIYFEYKDYLIIILPFTSSESVLKFLEKIHKIKKEEIIISLKEVDLNKFEEIINGL